MMRNILVDHARQHKAAKRGGEQYRLSLRDADRFAGKADIDLIVLDDSLKDLESTHPEHSRIVELRFFAGLTIDASASVIADFGGQVQTGPADRQGWNGRRV